MKVAVITDSHFGIRGDNVRFLDYFDEFYGKVFFPYLKEHEVDTIIHLGDLMDRRRYMNIYTARRMREILFDRMWWGLGYIQVMGNHDEYFKTDHSTSSYQVLGITYPSYSIASEIILDERKILLMPWICDSNREHALQMIQRTEATLCLGHLEFNGFEMYRGYAHKSGGMDPEVFAKFDRVYSGHYHTRSRRGNIQYIGAACEYTWQDWNDPRGFGILDTETGDMELIDNPIRMFHKIHYDDASMTMESINSIDWSYLKNRMIKVIVKNKSNPYLFDAFISRIEEVGPIEITTVEDHLNLDNVSDDAILSEGDSTESIISTYIDGVETNGIDREELKMEMIDIHREASSLRN